MNQLLLSTLCIFIIVLEAIICILLLKEQKQMAEKMSRENERIKKSLKRHVTYSKVALETVNAPLQSLNGMMAFISQHQLDNFSARQKEEFALVHGVINRTTQRLNELRDIVAVETENCRYEPIDMNSLVEEVLQPYKAKGLVKPLDFEYQYEPFKIRADYQRLKQILVYILELIHDHYSTGMIRVSHATGDNPYGLNISVYNTIRDEAWLRNLKDALHRRIDAQEITRECLTIILISKLMNLMGGVFEIGESRDFFQFSLLFNQVISEERNEPKSINQWLIQPGTTSIKSVTGLEKGHIAVLSKCKMQLHFLNSVLTEQGYNVFELSKVESLIAKGDTKLPELLIIEICENDNFGTQALKLLREKYDKLTLPILVCMTNYSKETVSKIFELGASDFVTFPLTLSLLEMRIAYLIGIKAEFQDSIRKELSFLQAQIKPHFLYNALSTVVAMCYTEPEKAAETLVELSRYLRLTFEVSGEQVFVPLRQELELIEAYVAIEKARFGNRIHFALEVDSTVQSFKIPFMLLQPFVENAIKHGICTKENGGMVSLRVKHLDQRLLLQIEDNGEGMTKEQVEIIKSQRLPSGTGLRNVLKRIELIKGCEFEIRSGPKGTQISIDIPIGHY